jgi:hypothetical protein
MEANLLDEYLINDDMPAGAEKLPLTWDANKFTGDLGRRMAGVYRECAERVEKKIQANTGAAKGKGRRRRKASEEGSLVGVAEELAASLELSAMVGEVEKEMYADALACDRYGILHSWGLTVGGSPLEPTFEELMKRSAKVVKAIFTFAREGSLPKKPDAGRPQSPETSTTTSLPTSDTSSPQTTPAPESPDTSNVTTSPDSSA